MLEPYEILPGIWTWSVHAAERGLDFNGWYVERRGEAVVVDPPASDAALAFVRAREPRPVAILLTNVHHTRDAPRFARELAVPLRVPAADAPRMTVPFDSVYVPRDALPCGLVATVVRDGKTPGETALLVPGEPPALIVGDAVIGKPAGALSMLPAEKFADLGVALAGVGELLALSFDGLLLGDGTPIPQGGRAALERFLTGATEAGG